MPPYVQSSPAFSSDVYVLLLHQYEEREILWKRVREFHVATVIEAPGTQNGNMVLTPSVVVQTVGIKRGGIVFHVQMLEHVKVMIHGRRAEPTDSHSLRYWLILSAFGEKFSSDV